jgi:hypothetical protein
MRPVYHRPLDGPAARRGSVRGRVADGYAGGRTLMRFPWNKIYRAFAELDRFSDEECERFLLQARAQRRVGPLPLVLAVVAVLGWCLAAVPMIRSWFRRGYFRGPGPIDAVRTGLLIAAVVGTPLLVYYIARDVRLRRALRGRIDNARCPRCRQSLLGLPMLDESPTPAVRCTECGGSIELTPIGLTPADLLPRRAGSSPEG